MKIVCFRLGAFLRPKSFRKEQNKQINRCPDSLNYYTIDVYLYQPTYREFICTKLFLFCDDLWESLLFMRIFLNLSLSVIIFSSLWLSVKIYDHPCESIFLILYENKQAYEYHHLKQIFYHQNTITIFFLISYVPILCFLIWILFILCLTTFLLNKVSLNSLNSVFTINIFHRTHLWL